MTRQEYLDVIAEQCVEAREGGYAVADLVEHEWVTDAYHAATAAARAADSALTHLAALEQQAITNYLADVPLPPGWTERPDQWGGVFYADEAGVERVLATERGVDAIRKPRHGPAIPQAVLVRAAVQCGRLREAGRS